MCMLLDLNVVNYLSFAELYLRGGDGCKVLSTYTFGTDSK